MFGKLQSTNKVSGQLRSTTTSPRSSSVNLRLKLVLALVAFFFMVSAIAATMTGSATSPMPAPVLPPNCTPPGVTVVTDASGDQSAPGTAAHDIQRISIAEPFAGAGVNQLVFTMKVGSLSGTLPANTQWKVYFDSPNATTYWVDMQTDGSSVVTFK